MPLELSLLLIIIFAIFIVPFLVINIFTYINLNTAQLYLDENGYLVKKTRFKTAKIKANDIISINSINKLFAGFLYLLNFENYIYTRYSYAANKYIGFEIKTRQGESIFLSNSFLRVSQGASQTIKKLISQQPTHSQIICDDLVKEFGASDNLGFTKIVKTETGRNILLSSHLYAIITTILGLIIGILLITNLEKISMKIF